jgi:cyclase
MMLRNRVIPVLLHDETGLVKTREFRESVYIGDPINAVRIFNQKEVDELILLEIGRSRRGLGPDFDLVERISSECFMPLGYGGGISSLDDAKKLFAIGIEKIVLQTAAILNPKLIEKISEFSGKQSVAVSVDVYRDKDGMPKIYHASKQEKLDVPFLPYVRSLQDKGCGEIILTSIHKEGQMQGMDLDLITSAKRSITIPIIAHGGARNIDDLVHAIEAGADAIAAGSMFVFYKSRKGVLINYPVYGELEKRLGISNVN